MKKIKLTETELTNIIKKIINERKKPKRKVEDSKYTKWCKEHGWEHGVGQGCADDALDSEDYDMRSWAIGFITGMKEGKLPKKTISEQTLPRHIRKGSPEHAEWIRSQQGGDKDTLLNNLLTEAQRLIRFIEDGGSEGGNWTNDDLFSIQENINTEITNYLK